VKEELLRMRKEAGIGAYELLFQNVHGQKHEEQMLPQYG
jgi:hypothetical protein